MSTRTYCSRELLEWSYAFLVSMVLAFSTLSVASTLGPRDYRPLIENHSRIACYLEAAKKQPSVEPACGTTETAETLSGWETALNHAALWDLENPPRSSPHFQRLSD